MKKLVLCVCISFTLINCGLFQKNNDSAKNGLLALLGVSLFLGNGSGGDTTVVGSSVYTAWGRTTCADGWTVAYTGYIQMAYLRTPGSGGSGVGIGGSDLICSSFDISTLTYNQSNFYSRMGNVTYQPTGEAMMAQFNNNSQHCAVCVK